MVDRMVRVTNEQRKQETKIMQATQQTFAQRIEVKVRIFKVYGHLRSDSFETFLGTISPRCASCDGQRHGVNSFKAIATKIRVEEV